MSGVKGIIEMHRFNICLVVVLSLSCSGVKTPQEVVFFCTHMLGNDYTAEPSEHVRTLSPGITS